VIRKLINTPPKTLKQLFRNKFTTVIILLVVGLGGYFGYQAISGDNEAARYTVTTVERGTLTVSVSGSGQVTVLNQVDIKPKVSGDLSAFYVYKDQYVKTDQVLATLDSENAERAIRDAEIALNDAKHDLSKAKEDYEEIEIEAERYLVTAYEDGYSTVSTVFFELSDYIKDLKDVLGTEQSTKEHITGYELILGRNSIFTQKLIDDYDLALDFYNENFEFFRTVFRDDDRDTIYQLIINTLETTEAISLALESARHMYDAITIKDYQRLRNIALHIDKMQPKIVSDVSSVYPNISSLRGIKDTIDDTNKNTPEEIEDAELAIQSFQNVVVKKEEALLDAKENLAEYNIYPPFNGFIAEVGDNIKEGDSVSANTVLATLITWQKIAQISLNEIDAANVKIGQKATLTFDALPEISITGRVLEVDVIGQVSQGVVSYGVKITFDTNIETVKPGMSVTADIVTEIKQDVLVLSSSAIKFQGNSYYVELVEVDEQFAQQLLAHVSGIILPKPPKMQFIEIGLSNDLSSEIISGLKEGDIIVTSAINQTNQTQQTIQNQGFRIPGMGGGGGTRIHQ